MANYIHEEWQHLVMLERFADAAARARKVLIEADALTRDEEALISLLQMMLPAAQMMIMDAFDEATTPN